MKARVVLLLETIACQQRREWALRLTTEKGRQRTCPGGCAKVDTPTLARLGVTGGRVTCRKCLTQDPSHKLTNKRGITSDALISLEKS